MFRLNLQAAVAAGGDAEAALGGGALADAGFLNELQAGVAAWVKEVQKVTTLHASHAVGAPQPGPYINCLCRPPAKYERCKCLRRCLGLVLLT